MGPSIYNPDEIWNSMFLPLMKKALMGGIGGRSQNTSLFIMGYSALSIVCYIRGAKHFLRGQKRFSVSAPDKNISCLPKNLPPIKKVRDIALFAVLYKITRQLIFFNNISIIWVSRARSCQERAQKNIHYTV